MTITDPADLLVTRSGVRLHVRAATGADEPALAQFFANVTPEDLRFRFLSTVPAVSHDRLVEMTRGDDPRAENLVVADDAGVLLATAMLAGDAAGERAEAAIAIRRDRKGLGIGWTLLDYLVGRARGQGYRTIEALEDRANSGALAVERDLAFERVAVEGDSTVVLVRKTLHDVAPE